MTNKLNEVLIRPELVDGLLCKVLTPNDDSGRHGILIPTEAYRMFPQITGFIPNTTINYTEEISTLWNDTKGEELKDSNYKHYHRYPERRITRLKANVNNLPPNSLIIIARRSDMEKTYEIHILQPGCHLYNEVLTELGIVSSPGTFFLDLEWTSTSQAFRSHAVSKLLEEFDKVNAMGYIKTLRSGSTGVGYTF